MSERNGLSRIRSITFENEPLFADVASGTERTLGDGTVVTATVENGKIMGYTARGKNGKPLKAFRLRIAPGAPPVAGIPIVPGQETCWYCFEDEVGMQSVCRRDPCPDPP